MLLVEPDAKHLALSILTYNFCQLPTQSISRRPSLSRWVMPSCSMHAACQDLKQQRAALQCTQGSNAKGSALQLDPCAIRSPTVVQSSYFVFLNDKGLNSSDRPDFFPQTTKTTGHSIAFTRAMLSGCSKAPGTAYCDWAADLLNGKKHRSYFQVQLCNGDSKIFQNKSRKSGSLGHTRGHLCSPPFSPPLLLQHLYHGLVPPTSRFVQRGVIPPVTAVDVSMGREKRAHDPDPALRSSYVKGLRTRSEHSHLRAQERSGLVHGSFNEGMKGKTCGFGALNADLAVFKRVKSFAAPCALFCFVM